MAIPPGQLENGFMIPLMVSQTDMLLVGLLHKATAPGHAIPGGKLDNDQAIAHYVISSAIIARIAHFIPQLKLFEEI